MEMTCDEQIDCIEALATVEIRRLERGQWIAGARGVEVKAGIALTSYVGRGTTIQEAIADLWIKLTDLPEGQYVVKDAMGDGRRAYRWCRCVWKEIKE